MLLYAPEPRDDVVGLVLVDPTPIASDEEQFAALSSSEQAELSALSSAQQSEHEEGGQPLVGLIQTAQPFGVARLLIVDDQAAFRRAAARVLARLPGFEPIGEAETGEASVEAARQLRPDLVLMDIHLPGIDGPEATRRILTDAAWPKAPPIVVLPSTYEAADYAAETLACGAAAYLPKAEFGPAALVAAWAAAQPT